jgi:hypothetical protein
VVRCILIVVVCAVALYLVWRIRGVVRLIAISLFLSLALLPVVDWVWRVTGDSDRRGDPDRAARLVDQPNGGGTGEAGLSRWRAEPGCLQRRHTVNALAVVLKPISCGWVVALTDGREIARFLGPGARRRALRFVSRLAG